MPHTNLGPTGLGVGQSQRGATHLASRETGLCALPVRHGIRVLRNSEGRGAIGFGQGFS